jgi:hypothetical protein
MKLIMLITIVIILVVTSMVLFRKHSVKTNNAPTTPEKKFVIYQGARMVEGWPEQIEKAQTKTQYNIGGKSYSRVRYGDEKDDWGVDKQPCHDCRVIKGQFHVVGCDVESCPVCGGQVISCDCKNADIK